MPKTPRAGDKIRVTVEGTTTINWRGPSLAPGERLVILPGDKVTVEVIEPVWRRNDVIACKHGHTYIRTGEDTWLNSDGIRGEGPCIENTAVLLVRGGKPVSSAAQS